MSDLPSVAQAVAAVIAELPGIGKADKSPEGYQYRGIEAITKHLQPLLGRHGVVIVPSASIDQIVPSPEMKPGWQDVYLTVRWTIVGPAGDTLTAQTCGIGRDRADKGANKAQTQAYKYLLLHLLGIADKADDADGLSYEHGQRPEQVRRPMSPANQDAFLRRAHDAGVDAAGVAEIIAAATNDRTADLAEVFADEVAALRSSLAVWLDAHPAPTGTEGAS